MSNIAHYFCSLSYLLEVLILHRNKFTLCILFTAEILSLSDDLTKAIDEYKRVVIQGEAPAMPVTSTSDQDSNSSSGKIRCFCFLTKCLRQMSTVTSSLFPVFDVLLALSLDTTGIDLGSTPSPIKLFYWLNTVCSGLYHISNVLLSTMRE